MKTWLPRQLSTMAEVTEVLADSAVSTSSVASTSTDSETHRNQLKRSDKRWVRPSEVVRDGSEEELKTEELYRKVRSILNKLTPQKLQILTQQIIDLDIDTAERLEGAIDLIFEKAIDEAAFSVAYANMCRCLIPKKVVVEKDGMKKDVTFRKILLNKCQKEFEKEKSVKKRIHERLDELSSKGLSEEELELKKRELQDEETLLKRRMLGNIRFIGELFKLKLLTENIMHDCAVKLLKKNDEEAFECVCKLLVTIGKDLDHEKAKARVDQYFTQINKIIAARKTSARVRFMMQDIIDLRQNNWVPFGEDSNPKTIDQIHKEAAKKAKKSKMVVQMAKQQDKKLRGNMGGRDSPRPNVVAPGDETWTTVGRGLRNVSVDPKKLQNIKRNTQDREVGRESPRLTPVAASPVEAASAYASVTPTTELSEEVMKNKALSITDEYLNIRDIKEALECFKELQSPSTHHVFVNMAFNHTMEKKASDRTATGKLLQYLLRDGALTPEQYLNGVEQIFKFAEELEIDIPQLWKYIAEFIGPTAFHGNLNLDALFQLVLKYVSKNKAAKFLARMLQTATDESSCEDVSAILSRYRLSLNTFFETEDEAVKFAKDKNIEYALGQDNSPQSGQHSARIQEELRTLILKRKASNEEVDQLKRSDKRMMRPSEVPKEGSEEELETENHPRQRLSDGTSKRKSPQERIHQVLEFEQRVVTFIEDNPARRTVRYIGEEEDLIGNLHTIVGLEMDECVGNGNGKWNGRQLFRCETGFAVFVDIRSLIREEDYDGNHKETTCTGTKTLDKQDATQEHIREDEMKLSGKDQLEKNSQRQLREMAQRLIEKGEQEENLQRQLREMGQRLRENDEQGENVQRQLRKIEQQLREKDEQEENLQRQLREMRQQLRGKDEQGENFQRQVREMEQQLRGTGEREENLQRQQREMEQQLREKDEQEENLRRQQREMEQQLREKDEQEENLRRQQREMEQQLREKDEQGENSQRQQREMEQQLREKDEQEENLRRQQREMEQQLREKDEQEENLQRQQREMEQQLREKEEQEENLQRHLREMEQLLTNSQGQCREKEDEAVNLQEQITSLERKLRFKDQQLNELEITLLTAQQALSEHQRQQVTPDWVISRDQIQLTDKLLGRGGWGSVVEGKYCGCAVAVKQIHELILSPYNRTLFEREMDIASRCRHPCLLQFIGATNEEGEPVFVTELMESSLRALLEQRPLVGTEVSTISLDVARALNYLHQRKPFPIIHRDISSANVLLWRQGEKWRGKVSDYGTANFMQHTMTVGPGAMIYMAPEALTSKQSVKVDVYSFGVLLCEMCIRELPDPERRDQQIAMVTNRPLRALIRRCLQSEPASRPNMEEILEELEEPV